MKNTLLKIVALAVWIVVGAGVVAAKDWRGIVLLKSTRVDVERVFGVPKQSSDPISYYDLSHELVVFHFQAQDCDSHVGKMGFGWNVPPGTVVEIGVIPKGKHRRTPTSFELGQDRIVRFCHE